MSLDNDLHEAASDGNVAEMNRLISMGADIEARGLNGMTPLFQAVGSGQFHAVEALVTAGANIHHRPNNSKTALDMAIAFREAQIARLLDSKGCTRTTQDPWSY